MNFPLLSVFLTLLIASALISMIGCGGSSGGGGGDRISIQGYVSESRGGPALSGSKVYLDDDSDSDTTESDGYYTVSLEEGTFYDLLADKTGYAQSKIQQLWVMKSDDIPDYPNLNMVQMKAFNPDWEVEAPTISVSGVERGETVSGTVNLDIEVEGANPILLIQVRAGDLQGDPLDFVSDSDTMSYSWDTTTTCPGDNFVLITAYDVNYNCTQYFIPVVVATGNETAPSSQIEGIYAYSMTFERDLEVFAKERTAKFKKLNSNSNPYIVQAPNGSKVDLSKAPQNASVIVYVEWTPDDTATGYRIYRATSSTQDPVLVGEVPGGDTYWYYDYSADLKIGKKYYYYVSAYNTGGEGPLTETDPFTVLGRFVVNLKSPSDGSTGVSTTPTFKWEINDTIGDTQRYIPYAMGQNDEGLYWYAQVSDTTSVDYSDGIHSYPLMNATVYEWDMYYCYALGSLDSDDYYRAVSYANPNQMSTNGAFTFTTEE